VTDKNFLILSMHDDKIKPLTDMTLPNKQEYCDKYSYMLQSHTPKVAMSLIDWNGYKTNLLKSAIQQEEYDWIVWIDADALIMNMTIPLTKFIDDDYELIIGEDWNGLNNGVFFMKACKNSVEFLDMCQSYEPTDFDRNNTPFWWWPSEQCSYTRCLSYIKSKVVHHSLFNGLPFGPCVTNDWRHAGVGPVDYDWTPKQFQVGDFILHVASGNMPFKLNYFYQYLPQVIK